jgi:hypothetical protein
MSCSSDLGFAMAMDDDITRLNFIGGPLDDEEQLKASAELLNAIGLATCVWARVEQLIDAALIYLNQPKHSEKIHDPDHPIGFKRKIKLLKRWFNQHPALADHRDVIREITTELLELSGTRNAVLHSILDSYDPNTKTLVFRSIQPAGRHISGSQTHWNNRDVANVRSIDAKNSSPTCYHFP